MMVRPLAALASLLVLGSTQLLFAQRTLSLRGFVIDATGASIAGATVEVDDLQGVTLSEVKTDDTGVFNFQNLASGDYKLVVPAYASFAVSTTPIHLTAPISGLRVVLSVASVTQNMDVTADETLSTEASSNRDTISVSANDLRKTPIFDQDPIATLIPFLDSASGSSGGVTLIVDGMEVKSANVSPSAIQEIRINSDPYSAEYTRPGRGRVEVITKPGSPQYHGELNVTFRDAIFNAKNHLAIVRPPEARRIYEGHLSGPIGNHGKTSFLTSITRQEQDTAVVVNAVGVNGPINQNVLTPNRRTLVSGRVTHDFSANHRLSFGYAFKLVSNVNMGVGGIILPEAGYDTSSREDDLSFNDRLILTPNLINQLQVMFEKDEDINRSATNASAVFVSGSFVAGGAQADIHQTENTVHVNDIVSWSHGRHYISAGVQLPQFSRRGIDDQTNRQGTLKYSSLTTYAANTPYVFSVQQGVGRTVYWINEFGSFVQDQIKVNNRLQVSLGLRYDWQAFLGDNNNLAPRVSVAYAPDKGKTIIRAGSGLFYDRTGGDFPATVKLHDGFNLRTIQIQNPIFPLPSGADLIAFPSNITRFASNVRSPYSIQYSAGVERKIGKGATIAAEYRGQVQVKAFRSRDTNAPVLPPNASLTGVYSRPNPSFGQIQSVESGGRAMVNAFDLSFRGRVSRWFSGQAQYTFAHFENNTGGIGMFPQDQYRPNAEWGRADVDRRHKFNLIGNINPDHWLSLGIAATIYSGTPYTETTGDDNYHTGLGNARPAGVGRNTLQGSGVTSFDVLYNHDFRLTKSQGDNAKVLSGGISAFNVFNQGNYTSYIGALSSSRFGRPTAALPGRQIQFSLGYRF